MFRGTLGCPLTKKRPVGSGERPIKFSFLCFIVTHQMPQAALKTTKYPYHYAFYCIVASGIENQAFAYTGIPTYLTG